MHEEEDEKQTITGTFESHCYANKLCKRAAHLSIWSFPGSVTSCLDEKAGYLASYIMFR